MSMSGASPSRIAIDGARLTISTRPIDSSGLRERVQASLLEWLATADYDPETPLRVEGIAASLGVSPTPVREALATLAATGAITYIPRRGYRVAPRLDAAELAELFEARAAIESAAVRLATIADPTALSARLEAAIGAQDAAARRLDSDPAATMQYLASDRSFHESILEMCGNRFLREMDARLGALPMRTRQTIELGVHDADEAIREHRAVVDAVSAGGDAAAVAMSRHIAAVARRSIRDLPAIPGGPSPVPPAT